MTKLRWCRLTAQCVMGWGMGDRDPRVDVYIANSGSFARPILVHLRALVHRTCPQVRETMKWNFPHFMYHGMLCAMAAFKQHCAFGFWKSELIAEAQGSGTNAAMGQFGRIAKRADLPADAALAGYIRQAMLLNEHNVKKSRSPLLAKPAPVTPADLAAALQGNAKASETFAGFTPGQRRDYIDWIEEAKRDATRAQRIVTTVEWVAQGKRHNWKYKAR